MNMMLRRGRIYGMLLVLVMLALDANGQKIEKLKYKADVLENFKRDKQRIRKLVGNVVFTQQNTVVYCDSSYFYIKENVMEAFGKVRIIDDSVTITSRKLIYEGNTRTAKLRDDVVYKNGTRTLYTDFLDYNMITSVAHFYNGGRLVDVNNNLKSKIGFYYDLSQYVEFFEEVVLETPEYVLEADTLKYTTTTKVAYTPGPTTITTPDGVVLNANGGEYQTIADQSIFIESDVETRDYILEADELFLDDIRQYYTAEENVVLTAKERDVIITGDHGIYWRDRGVTKVFGNALMKKVMAQDTFYLKADTLVAIETEVDADNRILAYPQAKIYRVDLQGLADSIAYVLSDSIIHMYSDPILWNVDSQIEGDTISIQLANELIDKMYLNSNAFVISLDTIRNFNQIKGRKMISHFNQGQIDWIDVNGNGESLYYALTENQNAVMGINRILCSNMLIRFKDGILQNISFYNNPEGRFIPPHEVTQADKQLTGFNWRSEEKPKLTDVVPYFSKGEPTPTLLKKEELKIDSPKDLN